MDTDQPTTRQIIVFTVVLSFIVSIIGTVLAIGVFGPILGLGEGSGGPVLFNKPLEKIRETITQTEQQVTRQDELVVKVVEDASPSVVSVVASKDVPVIEQYFVNPFESDPFFRQFFGENPGFSIPEYRQKGTQKQAVSSGTGFIISSEGLILTNRHVVADTEAEYTVFFNDGKKKAAKVLARDPVQDLAVLKVEGANYPTLKLGDSSQIKIGQSVIAIGNALGEFSNTVSVGVVSGLHRSVMAGGEGENPESLQELIQTDAAINPGNSGGPLLNIYGEVVGINTAIVRGAENIGFAIPINRAKRDIDSVKKQGKIIYPFLGVRYVVITPDLVDKKKLGRDYGVLLLPSDTEPVIVPGSPAERAGIKENDIILQIDGERIDAEHNLASLIQKHQVGDEVTLKIFRDGKESDVKVKLEERK